MPALCTGTLKSLVVRPTQYFSQIILMYLPCEIFRVPADMLRVVLMPSTTFGVPKTLTPYLPPQGMVKCLSRRSRRPARYLQ